MYGYSNANVPRSGFHQQLREPKGNIDGRKSYLISHYDCTAKFVGQPLQAAKETAQVYLPG